MKMTQINRVKRLTSRFVLLTASVFTLGLASCAGETNTSESASANPEEQLQVVTTILPITNFTKAVAGNRAEVTPLFPPNIGPHDYQVKPDDALRLSQADMLVINGLEMETFLDDLIANAENDDLVILDTSEGIATLENEDDGHGHSHDDDHGHNHSHGEVNPHIWLDPQRVMQQVENIRDGLIALDPEGEAIYTENADAYLGKLEELDQEIATTLAPYEGKTFVTYHDFAPYFAERYSLKAEYLVGIPMENPAPGDVQRVMKAVETSQLKTLLTEPQAGDSPFTGLAEDLKIKVSTFDPVEVSRPEGTEPDYYLTVMRSNLKNLEAAFGEQESVQSVLPILTLMSSIPVPVMVGW